MHLALHSAAAKPEWEHPTSRGSQASRPALGCNCSGVLAGGLLSPCAPVMSLSFFPAAPSWLRLKSCCTAQPAGTGSASTPGPAQAAVWDGMSGHHRQLGSPCRSFVWQLAIPACMHICRPVLLYPASIGSQALSSCTHLSRPISFHHLNPPIHPCRPWCMPQKGTSCLRARSLEKSTPGWVSSAQRCDLV